MTELIVAAALPATLNLQPQLRRERMKRTWMLAAILAAVVTPLMAGDKDRDDDRTVRTHLVGYNETPLTIKYQPVATSRQQGSAKMALPSNTSSPGTILSSA
jgi:hypothetical protein